MSRPKPVIDQESQPYWDGAREHKLLVQRCAGCGQHVFYPRVYCPHCHGDELTWIQASGRGTVYSLTVVRRAAGPAFADDVPYVIGLIDLEEGVRLLSRIQVSDPDDARIGMAVQVAFEDFDDLSLPVFTPAGALWIWALGPRPRSSVRGLPAGSTRTCRRSGAF